jgi:hypothetical protein
LREDPQQLHPLPTFVGRLLQITPYLLELAFGLAFLFWAIVLLRQVHLQRKAPPPSNTTSGVTTRPRWTPRQFMAVAGYLAVLFPILGERFARFLWPLHSRRIAKVALLAATLLTLVDFLRSRQEKKHREQNAPPTVGVKEESWFTNDFVRNVSFIALTLGALFCSHFIVRRYWPTHERAIFPVIAALAVAALILLRHASGRPAAGQHHELHHLAGPTASKPLVNPERRKKLWLGVYSTCIVALMMLPISSQWKTGIFFGQIPALLIYSLAIGRLKMWTYRVGHDGDTDRALELNRRFAWIPGYGNSLEGTILFNAGRYREAQEFLKPFAFDFAGKPRLATTELYTYALALGNDGRLKEAQPLLEASIPVAEKPGTFRVALATNLLEQEKDPERARELLEQAMTVPPQSTAYGQRSDQAKRTARYAWALASCGRKTEADAKIQQALTESEGLRPRDLAGVYYFVGESWRAAGQIASARRSFQEALKLAPDGVIAIGAKKGLVKLAKD